MKSIESIMKFYGINEYCIKNDDDIKIVILNREKSLNINEWINLINSIKYSMGKDVIFLNDISEEGFNHVRSDD